MTRFFKENYRTQSLDKNRIELVRNVARGFNSFIIDSLESVDLLTADRPQQLSICELGIGGGGAHAMLVENTQDAHVLGVDLFDQNNTQYSNNIFLEEWDNFKQNQTDSYNSVLSSWQDSQRTNTKQNRKPSLFHGMDAYKSTTAEHLVKVNGAKLDYVNDDAAPDRGAMHGLMTAYRDSISDQGILISTGPFGNGTQEAYGRWESGEYSQDLDTLAKQGFVIFDMTEYRQQHESGQNIDYILSYLAMWTPDFNNYNDLLVKYEHNIIKGKENWKND